MSGTSDQPSKVSTEDTPPEPRMNVVTDENQPPAATDTKDDKAASGKPPSDQTTDTPATSDDKPKAKPQRNRTAERKVKALSRKLAAEQATNEHNSSRIAALEAQLETLKNPVKETPKPDIKDFNTPEEYAEAFGKWKVAQKRSAAPTEKPAAPPAKKPEPSDNAPPHAEDDVKKFIESGTKKLGDEFQEAIADKDPEFGINQTMGDFIIESELGPDLYLHLYHNRDEMRAIYSKSAPAAIKRLEALEAKIKEHGHWDLEDDAGTAPKGDKKPAKKLPHESRTPAPAPDPDRGNVLPEGDLDSMDVDDFMQEYEKRLKTRAPHLLS